MYSVAKNGKMIEISDLSNADDLSSDSNTEVEASNSKAASSSTRDTCSSSFFLALDIRVAKLQLLLERLVVALI